MNGARKFFILIWLAAAFTTTGTVFYAFYREFLDRQGSTDGLIMATVFALLSVAGYLAGVYLWHRVSLPGVFVESRSGKRITAIVLCACGLIVLIAANTSNAHFYLTSKSAEKQDILNLHAALQNLERTVSAQLTTNHEAFTTISDIERKNVLREVDGVKNPGICDETRIALERFNSALRTAVRTQSGCIRANSYQFRTAKKELEDQLSDAVKTKLKEIDKRTDELSSVLNDDVSKRIRVDVEALASSLGQMDRVPDSAGKRVSNVESLLQRGFAEFHQDKAQVLQIFENSSLHYAGTLDVNKLPKLAKTPYSSDVRTLGGMWSADEGLSKFINLKFFLSLLVAILFDLAIGIAFFGILRRND